MPATLVQKVLLLQSLLLHHTFSDETDTDSLTPALSKGRGRIFILLVHPSLGGDGGGFFIIQPRLVVLIRLIRLWRDILLFAHDAHLQAVMLLHTLLWCHRLCEQFIVQVDKVFGCPAGREYHTLQILGAGIHLYLQNRSHTHLILQYGSAPHTPAYQMVAATGAPLQHHQAYLLLLLHNHLHHLFRLFPIAVHIVEEEAANALASCQGAIHVSQIVCQL